LGHIYIGLGFRGKRMKSGGQVSGRFVKDSSLIVYSLRFNDVRVRDSGLTL
jgi:hypothetical protein